MAEKNKDKSEDSSMDKMYEIFSKLLEQQQQQQVKVSPEAVKYALEPNPVKLSGPANYVSWARHAQLILSSHGYENFLIGDDEKQKDGHVYTKQNNDRVLVWLLGSMEPIVRQQVEIMQTVYEVWSTLEKQFAGKSNKMQATRIMDELTHLKQGTKSETEYSGVAKRLYRDLHYFHPFEPVDKQDIAVHHKWFESLVAKFVPVLAPTSGEEDAMRDSPLPSQDVESTMHGDPGDDSKEIQNLKQYLSHEFEIKDMGFLRYFLGIEVSRGSKGFFLSQRKYVLDLLRETGMYGSRPAATPIEQNHRLCSNEGRPVDRERYQRLVGRLIYLSHTHPDIAFAVSVVSQFMHDPKTTHLEAVNRILRYLKGCPGKGLLYIKQGNLKVECYTDADWAGSLDDRRSTSGYCTFVGGNLVSWRSKKQGVVARSTAEAEFRAMAQGLCELLWLQILLSELKLYKHKPLMLYCDNKAAIDIANNLQHDRTKHIEIDRHFIKEKLDSGIVCLPYVSSASQVADALTKGLPEKLFSTFCSKMGLYDVFAPS